MATFEIANRTLSRLAAHPVAAEWLYKLSTRLVPLLTINVRGVSIRVIAPFSQHGVYAVLHNWEKREPETLDWIDSFNSDSLFFDIGANFGNESLYAALRPNGPRKIISFDVDPYSQHNLANNIQLDGIQHIDQYSAAVGANSGFIDIEQYGLLMQPGRARTKTGGVFNRITFKAWAVSLDDFVSSINMIPNYIKIDVDGGEVEIVKGMRNILHDATLISVLIEVSSENREEIIEEMTRAGFTVAHHRVLGPDLTANFVFVRAVV